MAIVNETMARLIWGIPEVLGRTIEANDGPANTWQPVTIVGVAADAQLITLDGRAEPYIYVPLAQRYLSARVARRQDAPAAPRFRRSGRCCAK